MQLNTLKKDIKNIYYRGSLDFCNYKCSYCVFATKDKKDLKNDEKQFRDFIKELRLLSGEIRVMIIPYGEALIHNYYQEGIIEMAKMDHVVGVSCQTNLSFSTNNFIEKVNRAYADISKIKLWASFHPEMTDANSFLAKVNYLHKNGLDLCVGSVADSKNKVEISEMRLGLNSSIYLFVNAMEGISNKYSEGEINFWSNIDPLFECDKRNFKANLSICKGYKDTIFIDGRNDIFACPRSNIKLNLDTEDVDICKKKVCDCYIAYSNIPDTRVSKFMGAGVLWRVPQKNVVKAIFFDIDGTLTNEENDVIPQRYIEVLSEYSKVMPLYLETALPLESARKKLGAFLDVFKGGVFADGAHLKDGEINKFYTIGNDILFDENRYKIFRYRHEGKVYKYAVRSKVNKKEDIEIIFSKLNNGKYNLLKEDTLLTIVDMQAGKKNGLINMCALLGVSFDEIAVIGNSMYDWGMLSLTKYSCAVLSAEEELKSKVNYILNPDHLPILFK